MYEASTLKIRLDAGDVRASLARDFKDTAYPFFESDTLFLELCVVLVLVV